MNELVRSFLIQIVLHFIDQKKYWLFRNCCQFQIASVCIELWKCFYRGVTFILHSLICMRPPPLSGHLLRSYIIPSSVRAGMNNSLDSVIKKVIRTRSLLRKRSRCYHSASKTQVTDRISKLTHIHASVIFQITRIHWIFLTFRENFIMLHFHRATVSKKFQKTSQFIQHLTSINSYASVYKDFFSNV